jgi:hypothetical protein
MQTAFSAASGRPSQPERRAHHRLGFRAPAHWDLGGVSRPGLSHNVSEAGAGFVTRRLSAPRIGDRIRLVYELDDAREWVLDESAEVVRCDPIEDGLCDVGVRLQPMAM